jgi:hypothetical protein
MQVAHAPLKTFASELQCLTVASYKRDATAISLQSPSSDLFVSVQSPKFMGPTSPTVVSIGDEFSPPPTNPSMARGGRSHASPGNPELARELQSPRSAWFLRIDLHLARGDRSTVYRDVSSGCIRPDACESDAARKLGTLWHLIFLQSIQLSSDNKPLPPGCKRHILDPDLKPRCMGTGSCHGVWGPQQQ